MTTRRQARSARRKLKAHDRGQNRHHKLIAYQEKRERKARKRGKGIRQRKANL